VDVTPASPGPAPRCLPCSPGMASSPWVVIQLAASALRGLWLIALSRRLYPALRVRFGSISGPDVRLIFSFSFFSFFLHVSGQVINYTDALVIATFMPSAS